ncbi:hypothetical protein [Citricoccus sp. GCM10030269]|uniref:hypothetical protein n=1 Tax=Citricoccus sp. GCM10030269 TaxID=3273388 RepID=UPI003613F23E
MYSTRRAKMMAMAISSVALLTACSGGQSQQPTPTNFTVEPASTDASATPTSSPSPTRNENDRGDLIKEVGEVAGMANPEDPEAPNIVQFKVTDIKPGACTNEYADGPATGNHFLQVDLEVETKKEMREGFEQIGASPASLLFQTDWHGFDSNGTTMNSIDSGATQMCLDESEQIPYEIGPAEKALGSVILEVSDTKGEIAHRPWFMGGGGWTWEYDISKSL